MQHVDSLTDLFVRTENAIGAMRRERLAMDDSDSMLDEFFSSTKKRTKSARKLTEAPVAVVIYSPSVSMSKEKGKGNKEASSHPLVDEQEEDESADDDEPEVPVSDDEEKEVLPEPKARSVNKEDKHESKGSAASPSSETTQALVEVSNCEAVLASEPILTPKIKLRRLTKDSGAMPIIVNAKANGKPAKILENDNEQIADDDATDEHVDNGGAEEDETTADHSEMESADY